MDGSIKFSRLTRRARKPTPNPNGGLGLILYSAYQYVIPANGSALVYTDLSFKFPPYTAARILSYMPRGVIVGSEPVTLCVEETNNVFITVYNFSSEDFTIHVGDPVAQIFVGRLFQPILQEEPVSSFNTC
ncbi:dUTP pyrophosphatase [Egyptian fruit bat adenovirus]|uniref:dUTP pyrophosphatase n=1 Tax=Egyptian fruit bat adenovirus TaxID=2849732 RepID=A0A344X9W2_9ADEN|nr:dUTP pyrophosphatase [Rousettus aegyptiacus adenovirus]AXE75644.1 dUTP pyrophosphatase [Egyptian fruit bat adenovirus]